MDFLLSRLHELPPFFPTLQQVVANLPILILFLWGSFIFSIMVYFKGGIKDLEEKMGKGSMTRLHIFLIVASSVSFVSMLALAFYLILRPH